MAVLVAAASRHGATAEIADWIGAGLADRGLSVEVKELGDVDDVAGYDAFVLGSAVYLGKWLEDAIRFVDAHADELTERPTWLFGSGSIVGNPPVDDDPKAMRASLVEKLMASTHAREYKLFAGKLDSSKLGSREKLPVRMAHGREGDWRNWQQVDAWTASIADALRQKEVDTVSTASGVAGA
jgi:menaquinone-dependent protoporphyrinogen oxidase